MKFFYSVLFAISFFFSPLLLNAGDKTVSINDVSQTEGDSGTKIFTFIVTATDNVDNSYTIDYITVNGTATAGSDYIAGSGTVNFNGATNSANINITINSDTIPEADETFTVIISNPQGGSAVSGGVADGHGVGTIINDDTQDWPPIISDVPDQIAIKDVIYSLSISDYVTEVNGDTVTYTLSGDLPAGLTFYPNTGILSGTPTELGEFPLSVYATDKDGNSATDALTLTVDYGFCYEYAYKQQDVYFTEQNFDGHYPKLVGNEIVTNNEAYPVKMTLYLRHRSSLDITDSNLDILDIDTTQVEYVLGTTELANKSSIIPSSITDNGATTSSNIYNIPLGSLSSGDYFYIDYDLNPKLSTLDTPINAELSFTVSGNNYELTFGDEIPLCSLSSGIGYTPVSAIFNIIHNSYYNSTTQYYNLPTQVVKKLGNFGAISLEPSTDALKEISNVPVEVELIDVDMYGGDAEAACQEPLSAITPRVLFIFGPNDTNTSYMSFNQTILQNAINEGTVTPMRDGTTLSTPSDFYKKAVKNTAFRVSYRYVGDDGDLIQIENIDGSSGTKYNVLNFPDAVKLGECVQDMDGKPNNSDMVAQYCSNAGVSYASAMTPAELRTCLECVYGLNTKLTCSRDNFSIRPEAFKLKLDDQNQTDTTSQTVLTSPADIAAGYNYNIEVTATSHIDENPALGYSKTFTETTPDKAQYIWNSAFTECNDDTNKTTTITFDNGIVDGNTSIQQVGDYILNITDTTWTAVDWNQTLMEHHVGSYFIPNTTPDCSINSSDTSSTIKAGCNISSSHTNHNISQTYNDFVITSHPYKFDLNITSSSGLNNLNLPYVYMADI